MYMYFSTKDVLWKVAYVGRTCSLRSPYCIHIIICKCMQSKCEYMQNSIPVHIHIHVHVHVHVQVHVCVLPSVLCFKENELLEEFAVCSIHPPEMSGLSVMLRAETESMGRKGRKGRKTGRQVKRRNRKRGGGGMHSYQVFLYTQKPQR